MPSWELFEKNSEEYKNSILPPDVTTRLAVEAGIPMGWERYVGSQGKIIGMTGFGASAPGGTVLETFGFSAGNVAAEAEAMVKK
jgi:transketolase